MILELENHKLLHEIKYYMNTIISLFIINGDGFGGVRVLQIIIFMKMTANKTHYHMCLLFSVHSRTVEWLNWEWNEYEDRGCVADYVDGYLLSQGSHGCIKSI